MLFLVKFFTLGTMSMYLRVSELISARNQGFSDGTWPTLGLMQPHVPFILLVEQLLQLSHPPELDTEVSLH